MGESARFTGGLLPTCIDVRSDDAAVVSFLMHFYAPGDPDSQPAWTIHVGEDPKAEVAVDHGRRAIDVRCPRERLSYLARVVVREAMLAVTVGQPLLPVHASAYVADGGIWLCAGDSRAGKTSRVLDEVVNGGAEFVANDIVLVSDDAGSGVRIWGPPTWVKLRSRELDRYGSLLDLAYSVPAETKGEQYLTFRAIPRPAPPELRADWQNVRLVMLGGPPTSDLDARVSWLAERLRADWVDDQDRTGRLGLWRPGELRAGVARSDLLLRRLAECAVDVR